MAKVAPARSAPQSGIINEALTEPSAVKYGKKCSPNTSAETKNVASRMRRCQKDVSGSG